MLSRPKAPPLPAEAAKNPQRIVVVDATRDVEKVHADIRDAAEKILAG